MYISSIPDHGSNRAQVFHQVFCTVTHNVSKDGHGWEDCNGTSNGPKPYKWFGEKIYPLWHPPYSWHYPLPPLRTLRVMNLASTIFTGQQFLKLSWITRSQHWWSFQRLHSPNYSNRNKVFNVCICTDQVNTSSISWMHHWYHKTLFQVIEGTFGR